MTASEALEPQVLCTDECGVSTGVDIGRPNLTLHLFMAVACAVMLIICGVGYFVTRMPIPTSIPGACVVIAVSFLPALLFHDWRQYDRRDAALALPWMLIFCQLTPYVIMLSARAGFPLRDGALAEIDQALSLNVPSLMEWACSHPALESMLNQSYNFLGTLLRIAIFLPVIVGRKKAAEEFLLSSTIAFLLALPIFTFSPAIGPWVGHHFAPDSIQAVCEQSIAQLRDLPHVSADKLLGIICFPSFHVILSVLCVFTLRSFRFLCWPGIVLAVVIVISTVTTGWHYGIDVLGGLFVASAAIWITRRVLSRSTRN